MTLRAVIFDFDGTVADSLPLCVAAFRKAIEPLAGRTVSDAEVLATFGPSEEGTITALIPQHFERGLIDYEIENHHEPIISLELFDRVQTAKVERTNIEIGEDGRKLRRRTKFTSQKISEICYRWNSDN